MIKPMKKIKAVFLTGLYLLGCSYLTGKDMSVPITGGSTIDLKNSNGLIYLQTDRSCYLPGESILFKAYVLNDSNDRSASINDTLQVALLDQEGMEVAAGTFPLNNSIITGNIELPDNLTEGNYILIASAPSINNLPPEKMFSRIIEIRENFESDLVTDLSLSDTLYESGSQLTAQIRFSGKGNKPVTASFSYQLTGKTGEILSGKSKTNSDGIATLKLQLPSFDNKETLKLLIIPSYKGNKTITGIVIPTKFNLTDRKKHDEKNITANEFKQLNIQLKTVNLHDDKVYLDISVTDDKGNPVMANLSVSASNIIPHQLFYDYDIVNYVYLKKNQSEINSNTDTRKYYAQVLLQSTESPGKQFIVQEKNNSKKLFRKENPVNQKKQEGYSTDRNIFDIIMSIKPYHLENGKITFGISTMNSINNQDGALIIVDGIKMGTDASILSTLPVQDIAHISASTNVMDIQRYSAMNNVGIIEITMKKTSDFVKKEQNNGKTKSNTLFWGPDLITDKSGKSSISFLNNTQSSEILISVEGVAANGLSGSSTIRYSGK
jgi:hypothetical protein